MEEVTTSISTSTSADVVLKSPLESNGLHNAMSPSRSFHRNSSPRNSSNSKGGKLSDYLCGLKKKKSKERNGSGEPNGSTTGSGTPAKMSKSNFYCSSSSASPSPTDVSPPLTVGTDYSLDENNGFAKLASIGSEKLLQEGGGDDNAFCIVRDSVQDSPLACSDVENNSALNTGSVGGDQAEESAEMDRRQNVKNSRKLSVPLYTLTVHLIKGKDLVIADKSGSSDPYVKVKLAEKNLYKTKVISKNLNPIWDESFTALITDINDPLIFKVVDYDWGSKDDPMGMCITNLRKITPNGKANDLNLPLSMTGLVGEKSMGELSVSLILTPRSPEEDHIQLNEAVTSQAQKKMQKQTWNGKLSVLLIDIRDLPVRRSSTTTMSDRETGTPQWPGGYSNVFAKLRLGNQKRRSKLITEETTRPEWLEPFDFYLYDTNGQTSIFEIDFFEEASAGRIPLGSATCDIPQNMPKDKTKEYLLNFTNGLGRVRLTMTLTGFRPTPSSSPVEAESLVTTEESLSTKYALRNTIKLESLRDVGHLSVKVIQAEGLRAADLGGKSDPFCVLELINTRVQTHTEYKTLTPNWNKTFDFDVHDITSILEVTVYDEDRDHKRDFLGKINIPLWKIQNGEAIWYKLKNRKLAKGARGNNPQILLQMNLIWNPIRAAIRVTDPQEMKYCQPKPELKIETFLVNMERLRLVLMDLYDIWLYIKSCLDWEYPERSIKALTFYLLTCYFFQPFFVPLYLLIYWLRPWWRKFVAPRRNVDTPSNSIRFSNTSNANADDTLNLDESDDDEEGEIKKLSLVEKFKILQDASGLLQELVGEVAAICESTVNTRRMVVPFIYWLFAITFAGATLLLLLVDFRYVAMLYGIHEFSRIYLRPWKQSSFEIYHMIRRVPHQMNLGDKLGINSVLKSIQQLKNPATKRRFWKREKSTSTTPSISPTTATSWYVEHEG